MKIIKLFVIAIGLVTLCSCAVRPPVSFVPGSVYPPPVVRHDITHVVGPGETLWRISKIYDVDIEHIMRANKLHKSDKLTMGQKLIIPGAMPACSVVPLYPSNKWKYIIIHHSASDEGDALQFHKSHMNYRKWSGGLGYHFVIDNGSYGKPNGYIEVSPRWLKQQNGAHCRASNMNHNSIGVCLVGNFSKSDVSSKQLSSLLYLVDLLRRYYRIPLKNIMGHGQVPGASTECPGKRFPWNSFLTQLKNMNGRSGIR